MPKRSLPPASFSASSSLCLAAEFTALHRTADDLDAATAEALRRQGDPDAVEAVIAELRSLNQRLPLRLASASERLADLGRA